MEPADAEALLYDWPTWARSDQRPPEWAWSVWLLMGGRGSGKTRAGAEWVRSQVKAGRRRIALVGETAADARDVMVEGESGILSCCYHGDRTPGGQIVGVPKYEPSKRRLTWANGAMATTYSADDPEQLRGPQHDAAWADEIGQWRYDDAWDQLTFGLRLGVDPQCVVTTTPRTRRLIRMIAADPGTMTTGASTYRNRAFLAASFFDRIIRRFEGTRLGRQELHGELIGEVPGALWTIQQLDATRVRAAPEIKRIVVGVDPAASSEEDSDETGIIVGGQGIDGHMYVLEDVSGRGTPEQWAQAAIEAYDRWKADLIVGEVNNGGEMVGVVIRSTAAEMKRRGDRPTDAIAFKSVWASKGKVIRAEPISALYEQGRAHHVGTFAQLEDQMAAFTIDFDRKTAGYSPDRLDALVWAATELMLGNTAPIVPFGDVTRISPYLGE